MLIFTTLWKQGCVVIDIFEIDLNIGVAHQAIASIILSKNCESPLGSSRGFIPIQRFQNINFPSGTINVKLRLVRLIWIYTLTSQKVDYVVLAVFITISSCDLMIYIKIQILGWTLFFSGKFDQV